ncbi:hypothetical protein HMPREF0239_04514 [Clostridium sp. ATCC BAA-442]|nr:hypothetical protein HMPREF0239_04514 [Clostridium sp. ATCC BAA-442]
MCAPGKPGKCNYLISYRSGPHLSIGLISLFELLHFKQRKWRTVRGSVGILTKK